MKKDREGKNLKVHPHTKNLPPLPTSRNRRAFSPYKLSYLKGVIEMQEAKDLHFTENYLPQISKKSGMDSLLHLSSRDKWRNTNAFKLWDEAKCNVHDRHLHFWKPVPRSTETREVWAMPSRGGNSFLCCNIWKNKPQPFLKWVKRHYLGKGSPKGNFAKVISLASEQETFPKDANLDITISSLQTRYACSETIQTATNRWKEYVKTHNKNSFFFLTCTLLA